jgi:hypothetical protein
MNITNKENSIVAWALFYRDHLYINDEVTDGHLEAALALKSVSSMQPFPLYNSSDAKVGCFNAGLIRADQFHGR